MQRTAERIVGCTTNGRPAFVMVTVPVTPRAQLQAETCEARSPLDALVKYCDRHAWQTASFGVPTQPPVPMDGMICAADRGDPPIAVRVVPVDVALRQDAPKRGQRERTAYWGGMYRVEPLD